MTPEDDTTPEMQDLDPLSDTHPLREKERQMDAAVLTPSGVQPGQMRGTGYITRNGHVVID